MLGDYPNDLRYSYTLRLNKRYVNLYFGLMYTYCLIFRWFQTVILCLLHILYFLVLFFLCVNLKK